MPIVCLDVPQGLRCDTEESGVSLADPDIARETCGPVAYDASGCR
jgi:hypothetical protein